VRVVGVDGCRGGWVAAAVDLATGSWDTRVHRHFGEVLAASTDAAAIAVDMPIGLASDGPRRCEELARRRLGVRRSSVFTPPTRRLLELIADESDYATANRLSWDRLGRGISVQAFNIFRKIREVDEVMTPELQARVREVHPELSFCQMRGGLACHHGKMRRDGMEERLAALHATCGWWRDPFPSHPPVGAGIDDVLDALAAAWTAARIARGEAETIPPEPELDGRGLRMEIVV
jgi:predicted RNase H-like nuclease